MKDKNNDGKGNLQTAELDCKCAVWQLIHTAGADVTTPEYEIAFKLLDICDEIERHMARRKKLAEIFGDDPLNITPLPPLVSKIQTTAAANAI